MAGADQERQERGLVNAVNRAVKKNGGNPITVMTQVGTLRNIVKATKIEGRNPQGNEPYTDVSLKSTGYRSWNLSLKGEQAPSLAGGGLEGLEKIVPGISGRFLRAAYRSYITAGYKEGDDVPDTYAQIPSNLVKKIVIGTKPMGGPIHYMYIGGMDVTHRFQKNNSTLMVTNGRLITSSIFASRYGLAFRLRRRRKDAKFILEGSKGGKDKRGLPMITHGRRIVTVDSIPAGANTVNI